MTGRTRWLLMAAVMSACAAAAEERAPRPIWSLKPGDHLVPIPSEAIPEGKVLVGLQAFELDCRPPGAIRIFEGDDYQRVRAAFEDQPLVRPLKVERPFAVVAPGEEAYFSLHWQMAVYTPGFIGGPGSSFRSHDATVAFTPSRSRGGALKVDLYDHRSWPDSQWSSETRDVGLAPVSIVTPAWRVVDTEHHKEVTWVFFLWIHRGSR